MPCPTCNASMTVAEGIERMGRILFVRCPCGTEYRHDADQIDPGVLDTVAARLLDDLNLELSAEASRNIEAHETETPWWKEVP